MKNLSAPFELLTAILLAEEYKTFLNAEEPILEERELDFLEAFAESGWQDNLKLTELPEREKRNTPAKKKRNALVFHSPYLTNNFKEARRIIIPVIPGGYILFKGAKVEYPSDGELSSIQEVFGKKAAEAVEAEIEDIRELLKNF